MTTETIKEVQVLQEKLLDLRIQTYINENKNIAQITKVRRDIARLLTKSSRKDNV
jgi:ribosomal protein L29